MTYPVAARALLRDTLLDAVGTLLDERGWSDVPMAEVARRAGVSRQTLYNEFGDRTGLAAAYVLREAQSFLADVEEAIARSTSSRKRSASRSTYAVVIPVRSPNSL